MYREIGTFAIHMLRQKALWKDGELWTALAGGVAAYCLFRHDPTMIEKIRHHLNDLLTTISIVFGFVLAALLFYIQAAAAWAKDDNITRIANKIVDWHVWTIVCMLVLIGYLLGLWSLGSYLRVCSRLFVCLHAFLVFLVLYCGFQILNHTLTVWWWFSKRNQLSSRR